RLPPRGPTEPPSRPCRLRVRRRAPPAPRWWDCRSAYRCYRRSAARTATPRDRHPRTRMRWFDRSALRVRRSSDRAAPRRGSPAWRSLGDGRSWPVLVLPGPGGPRILMLVYRSAVVGQGFAQPTRVQRAPLKARATFSALNLLTGVLGLLRAHRRLRCTARQRDAVERHALDAATEQASLLGGQRAGVHPHPGNLRAQTPVFDFRAAVHHDF